MSIADRLTAVRAQIQAVCDRVGRSVDSVRLVAVSKTRPVADVLEAYAAGQLEFGENRVQEAMDKVATGLPTALRLRMVGHLQKNKVRDACDAFHAVDSVDSSHLLERIDRLATRPMEVLVQVKLGDEPTKSGLDPADLGALLAAASTLRRVKVKGLMLVPPLDLAPRPFFRQLRELRDGHGGVDRLPELSMGMSHDFETAIEEGATLVRIGEGIFGPRRVSA